MFFAPEPQVFGVYVSQQFTGLVEPPEPLIRTRKIALHDEHIFFWFANASHQRQPGLVHGRRVLVVAGSG